MSLSIDEYASYLTTLISTEELQARIKELGEQITRDYEGREVVCVGVLKGVFPFYADLVRAIHLPVKCDFLGLSSYGSRSKTSGVVRLTSDLSLPVNGVDVIVIEDIVDTGLTMKYLLENMRTRSPKSVKICTLLHKPDNEREKVPIDYVGFTVKNHFVVGYGLDFKQRLRNLPYIGYFADEIPSAE